MHHHNCGCKHDLEYCAHCDIVYCRKCGREWGRYSYNYTYPWATWTSSSTIPIYYTTAACSHHGGTNA